MLFRSIDIVLGVTSFFTIAFGGLFVGMIHGLITAIITKYTKEVALSIKLTTFTFNV